VHASSLSAAQQRPDVVGVLQRVEDENERRLTTLRGPREDVVERCEAARLDDQCDALVAVEPGQRGQRATLDLDDRDAQLRGMQDELLECRPAMWDDQQAFRR
jgi:hypothetical protein